MFYEDIYGYFGYIYGKNIWKISMNISMDTSMDIYIYIYP